ncbi:MAG: aspartate kinase, partial [Acutalibacteraceae bacterium]|nr:aspartate kinase [Acutalibacteraceae bacterium]
MALIVKKFGGSSVANAERVNNVARIVTDEYKKGNNVVVVVSAQGDTTDDLIDKAKEINPDASKREMDMLLSAGEQISISLLAMAIEKLGFPVVSLLGWQAGFNTDSNYTIARIKRIDSERLKTELDRRNIVVVAGFQGLNKYDDITTLGRGGSDTSAVAIAAALKADLCQIYT